MNFWRLRYSAVLALACVVTASQSMATGVMSLQSGSPERLEGSVDAKEVQATISLVPIMPYSQIANAGNPVAIQQTAVVPASLVSAVGVSAGPQEDVGGASGSASQSVAGAVSTAKSTNIAPVLFFSAFNLMLATVVSISATSDSPVSL